jgi:hypothetical protein
MTSTPLPEQGVTPIKSEEKLRQLIEERIKIASTRTKSDDEVVQIAWLADGIDIWHSSDGKRGHSPAKARRYIISSVTRLITTLQRQHERELVEAVKDPFDYVEPCEPDCSAERHAYHQGQWDMAHRMADKGLTTNQEGEKL